jgi:hypothetical protein
MLKNFESKTLEGMRQEKQIHIHEVVISKTFSLPTDRMIRAVATDVSKEREKNLFKHLLK